MSSQDAARKKYRRKKRDRKINKTLSPPRSEKAWAKWLRSGEKDNVR